VRFVNAVLQRMRDDGTWVRLYDHWFSRLGRLGPADPPQPRYLD
jgi:polar amino acid transport system substrate-binding protein